MAAPTPTTNRTRPRPRSGPRGLPPALLVVQRELLVYRRLWKGSVFTYFVGPALYLAAIGVGLGGLIDAQGNTVAGLTYLQFVAPGLLAATIVQSISGESLWPTMAGTTWMRFYHAMVTAPLRPVDVYTGNLLWLGLRPVLSATSFVIVATAFGAVSSWWAVLAVPAAVLTGLSFAAPISAFAGGEESDKRFPLVMRFVVLPLFLFSGTFFPLEQLPGWAQVVAWCSPLWHGVELCRAAMTGTVPDGGVVMLAVHLAVVVGFIAAGWLWGVRTFTRKLTT